MLATTAWSYCPRVGIGLHDGIAPSGALFQGPGPTPIYSSTGPEGVEGRLKERDGGRCHSGYEQNRANRRYQGYELSVHAFSL